MPCCGRPSGFQGRGPIIYESLDLAIYYFLGGSQHATIRLFVSVSLILGLPLTADLCQ